MFFTKAAFQSGFRGAFLVLLTAPAMFSQPQPDAASVANAGSYIPVDFPNGGIARGGVFIVKGNFLGACGTKVADKYPLTTNMNGTSMKIVMGGASFDVPMIYVVGCLNVAPDQLAGIVPSNTPAGTGTLTITYSNKSADVPITVIDRGFGFYTINSGGSGAAIVQNFNSATDLVTNTLATSAKPGQYAIAWGTGLGPDGNPDLNAPVPTDIPIDLEFYAGGKRALVTYKGRASCCSGSDVIVFQVPDGLDGCYVPLVAKIGGIVSNFTTMSVSANGGPCSDANGLTAADITSAQAKGSLVMGILELVRQDSLMALPPAMAGPVARLDNFSGAITEMSFGTLIGLPVRDISTPGSCMVWRDQAIGAAGETGDVPVFLGDPFTTLSAGQITVSGAKGTKSFDGLSADFYQPLGAASYIDPQFPGIPIIGDAMLDPGAFTVSATGGTTVNRPSIGAFSSQITIQTPPTFSNRFAFNSVSRSDPNGLTVTWTGADPNGLVEIRGYSTKQNTKDSTAAFFCVERGSASKFTVPPAVLLSLPQTALGGVGLSMGIQVGLSGAARFTAPGVDIGFLRYNVLFGRNMNYQ